MPEPLGRLLVVDDEQAVRELVELAAEACGWSCDGAGTVADVEHRTVADYDLVLVDLALGDADGTSVLELLARRSVRADVLLMSGGGREGFLRAAVVACQDGLAIAGTLHKPFPLADLREALGACVGKRRG
ncbi:MAG TPA: response regulator [Candidatus Nanopelagicales bacterium]|nr:response regulator [Candidatus Nanopelagicales bacterium]